MDQLLNHPGFQKKLAAYAEQTGENLNLIQEEAAGYLRELYTQQKPLANIAAIQLSQFVLGRAYNRTIDVNPKELKAVTKLVRRHPVAFVMTHKTYIDMMVLGLVLARHGLPIPYIFAGINMDFMGLGQLGRQSGVIFIRRDIKDNQVYKLALRHFIAVLH